MVEFINETTKPTVGEHLERERTSRRISNLFSKYSLRTDRSLSYRIAVLHMRQTKTEYRCFRFPQVVFSNANVDQRAITILTALCGNIEILSFP